MSLKCKQAQTWRNRNLKSLSTWLKKRDQRVQRKICGPKNINVPFSIKRTLFKTFKSALLNVPLNLKNWGLNNYKKGTYNRNMRVGMPSASPGI